MGVAFFYSTISPHYGHNGGLTFTNYLTNLTKLTNLKMCGTSPRARNLPFWEESQTRP